MQQTSYIEMDKVQFNFNFAGEAGAVYMTSSAATMNSVNFNNNTAEVLIGALELLQRSNITGTRLEFTNNYAPVVGVFKISGFSHVNFTKAKMSNNNAHSETSVGYFIETSACNFEDGEFENNVAFNGTNAFLAIQTELLTFKNSRFLNN